jgi:hypothetical protein
MLMAIALSTVIASAQLIPFHAQISRAKAGLNEQIDGGDVRPVPDRILEEPPLPTSRNATEFAVS